MIKNYFKIAWRNMKRDRFFSLLNIVGLGFGLATSLLIVQYLLGEWSVDKHHNDFEQVYQINTTFKLGEGEENTTYGTGPSPLADKLVADFPEVQNATRMLLPPGVNKYLLKKDEVSFFEQKGAYVDNTFFSMFRYPFVEGSAQKAIQNPSDIVISEILAKKLFKGEPALGKTIEINTQWGDMPCNISGVVKTDTYRSHLDLELFINMETGAIGDRFAHLDEWAGNNMFYTYIKLDKNADADALEKKFPALVEATAGEKLRNLGFSKTHSLTALKDIYLKTIAKNNPGHQGNITFFYVLAAIGVFILIIACINFMNLTTARSSLRAKEVAVKKVLGAERRSLAFQFFSETILFVLLSLLVASVFIAIGQAYLQNYMGLPLKSFSFQDWKLGLWVLGILAFTAFLSGSYPALMLSSLNPVSLFRGKMGNVFSAVQIRRTLVVVQFVISIILIQGVLVINKQMNYVKKEDLGYSKTEKIVLPLYTESSSGNSLSLKQSLKGLAAVKDAGRTSTHPGIPNFEDMLVYGENKPSEETIHVDLNWVDTNFIPTMGFELLQGRNFRENDSLYAIITENALAGLGYTLEDAINKKVKWNWDIERSRTIVGVVKSFNDSSLKESMQPQVFLLNESESQSFLVASIDSQDDSQTISSIQNIWSEINPNEPFEYYFMGDKVQSAYRADLQMFSLIMIFTVLAILISCLGLVGLSAFAADRRKKEIGIRKVLGASVGSVVKLLSKEFIILVLVALLIATPIAWHYTAKWLNTFYYRIDMPWLSYVAAGVVALIICIGTVSFQSVKAAITNPVKSLKTE